MALVDNVTNYGYYLLNSTSSSEDETCDGLGNIDIRYTLAAIYVGLGVIGLFGNAAVIGVILRVIFGRGIVTNVYIYVLCLSSIDFAYSATGPFIVIYMIRGTWTFGDSLCRVMYICEGLNKTLSVYLLVVLSGDRYLAACRPYTSAKYRSVRAAITGLSAVAVAVIFTNVPIYMFTAVKASHDSCHQCGVWFPTIGTMDRFVVTDRGGLDERDDNVSSPIDIGDDYSSRLLRGVQWSYSGTYYLILLLALYYVTPAGMILAFYVSIVKRLRQQHRLLRKTSTKRNRVTKSVLAVVSFYFLCWTPYWCLQSVITFWPQLQYTDQRSFNVFVYLAYSIYALPYVNSCLDPVLYAFLNKRLWLAYAASRAGRRAAARFRLPLTSTNKENMSALELSNENGHNGHSNNTVMPMSIEKFGTVVEQLNFLDTISNEPNRF